MLYIGKHDSFYLYELTDTDLMWENALLNNYAVGNILFFGNKKDICLGLELAKADDLTTALAYLDKGLEQANLTYQVTPESFATLYRELTDTQTNLNRRDDLLCELTIDLESQRASNHMLLAQLEAMREQVSIEKLTRDEVLGDLQTASAETFRKDEELQKAIDAKIHLEQELAARICELLELDSANAELKKRLDGRSFDDLPLATEPSLQAAISGAHAASPSLDKTQALPLPFDSKQSIAQVYTMPSGKQIHIYHDFPLNQRRGKKRASATLKSFLRVGVLLFFGLLLFLGGSAVATAYLNNISIGEGLDVTLKTLLP
ncbi:MAG: hypothetical protein FWE41_02735 [Coriobacteriia bacterium]|nr:hypothetical protein [Coriobacteriia bacterium]MCL2750604.1 hypothetical protein [Coriobacteriia bacterium]